MVKKDENDVSVKVKKYEDPLNELQKQLIKMMPEKKIEISGMVLVIKPLGSKEETQSYIETSDDDPKTFIRLNKIHQLAYAIVEINGKRFEKVVDENGLPNLEVQEIIFKKKVEIISQFPQGFIDDAFNKLVDLMGTVEDNFKSTAEKNEILKKRIELREMEKEEQKDSENQHEQVNQDIKK